MRSDNTRSLNSHQGFSEIKALAIRKEPQGFEIGFQALAAEEREELEMVKVAFYIEQAAVTRGSKEISYCLQEGSEKEIKAEDIIARITPVEVQGSCEGGLPESLKLAKEDIQEVQEFVDFLQNENECQRDDDEDEFEQEQESSSEAEDATPLPKIGRIGALGSKRERLILSDDEQMIGSDEEMTMCEGGASIKKGTKKIKVSVSKAQATKSPSKPDKPATSAKSPSPTLPGPVIADPLRDSQSKKVEKYCCKNCTSRNVHRAILNEDLALFKKCFKENDELSNMNARWGPGCPNRPLDLILKNNMTEFLDFAINPQGIRYPYTSRASEQMLVKPVSTGRVGYSAYHARVRAVQMTRANKQGTNALVGEGDSLDTPELIEAFEDFDLSKLPKDNYKLFEKYCLLQKKSGSWNLTEDLEQFSQQVKHFIFAGNYKVAEYMMWDLHKSPNYGFNALHHQVLKDYSSGKKLPAFKPVSVAKKGHYSADQLTPLHFAAINPNRSVIKQLLDSSNNVNLVDKEMRKPIHLAAVCEGTGPLEELLARNANLTDIDNQKMTPLHYAAQANRSKNVRLILKKAPELLRAQNARRETPMSYILENMDFESIKYIIQDMEVEPRRVLGQDRMNVLHYAVARGKTDIVEWLLTNTSMKLEGKDKFGRTPFLIAIMNGHLKLASYLLHKGAKLDKPDSSRNYPIHYAAAYGWMDCLKFLLDKGACVNSNSSWADCPLTIALLKSHHGCVKILLDHPDIDLDPIDKLGRTPLHLVCANLSSGSHALVQKLISLGCDLSTTDSNGNTPFHLLIKPNEGDKDMPRDSNSATYIEEVGTLLIKHGMKITKSNKSGKTPIQLALDQNDINSVEFLLKHISVSEHPEILLHLAPKVLEKDIREMILDFLKTSKTTAAMMNVRDSQGFTPILKYIWMFMKNNDEYFNWMESLVEHYSKEFGSKWDQYEILEVHFYGGSRYLGKSHTPEKEISDEQKAKLTLELYSRFLIHPFFEFLDTLVGLGADPNASVGMRKKYLKLEEALKTLQGKKRAKAIFNFKKESLIKHNEALLKVFYNQDNYELESEARTALRRAQGLKLGSLPSTIEQTEKYSFEIGKQNAFHFAARYAHDALIDWVQKYKVDPLAKDMWGQTPLHLLSASEETFQDSDYDVLYPLLLKGKVDVADDRGRTPFMNFVEQGNFEQALELLKMKANPNQQDINGHSAFYYAVQRRNFKFIKVLVEDFSADINLVDKKGRNALHHAMNFSQADKDSNFMMESILIGLGIDKNKRDSFGRVPLHYAFTKIGTGRNNSESMDPIVQVAGLCACSDLQVNVADNWKRTPLHYASEHGSIISMMYMLKMKAGIEDLGSNDNTPLGIAMSCDHFNLAATLVSNGADGSKLINETDSADAEDREEKLNLFITGCTGDVRDDQDSDCGSDDENASDKDSDKDSDEDSGDDSEMSDDEDESKKTKAKKMTDEEMNDEEKGDVDQDDSEGRSESEEEFEDEVRDEDDYNDDYDEDDDEPARSDEPISIFRTAIRKKQFGVTLLILDQGYDFMKAILDALLEYEFSMALSLISKVVGKKDLCRKTPEGKTLAHVFCEHAKSCPTDQIVDILDSLIVKGVDIKAKDNRGRTTMHYAAQYGTKHLVNALEQLGVPAGSTDNEGHTPLTLLASSSKQLCLKPEKEHVFKDLLGFGCKINDQAPEPRFKLVHAKSKGSAGKSTGYRCTPLIGQVRRFGKAKAALKTLKVTIIELIDLGARLSETDSDGRDVLTHAVLTNNFKLVKFIFELPNKAGLGKDNTDSMGQTAVHAAMNSHELGYHDNIKVLDLLRSKGFSLTKKDKAGNTPAHYAAKTGSTLHLDWLKSKKALGGAKPHKISKPKETWAVQKYDFKADAEALIAREEKLIEKRKEENGEADEPLVKPDPTGDFGGTHEVFKENDHYWDVYLTKVDIRDGKHGKYVFYKIQLLADTVRSLYIVFTRWGRIGEDGMNQRSPFASIEEAKNEFSKIFQQKTSNNYNDLQNFERATGKYALASVSYKANTDVRSYLKSFKFKEAPAVQASRGIRRLLTEMISVTVLERKKRSMIHDHNLLPYQSLKKETLEKAQSILEKIEKEITRQDLLQRNHCFGQLKLSQEEVLDLSSRFYELIPIQDESGDVIDSNRDIRKNRRMVQELMEIEVASQMLLGAQHRQKQMHPVDYAYSHFQTNISKLSVDDPRRSMLKQYIKQSYQIKQESVNLTMYSLSRKGEAERAAAFKNQNNKKFLFHGSNMVNFIGILSEGLRVEPMNARLAGDRFGKGIYFSDSFSKAFNYANHRSDSSLVLVCEVTLGDCLRRSRYDDDKPKSKKSLFDSLWVMGEERPNPSQSVFIEGGVEVPLGPLEEPDEDEPEGYYGDSEYIIKDPAQVQLKYLIQVQRKE